jgi:hypothetical protein
LSVFHLSIRSVTCAYRCVQLSLHARSEDSRNDQSRSAAHGMYRVRRGAQH